MGLADTVLWPVQEEKPRNSFTVITAVITAESPGRYADGRTLQDYPCNDCGKIFPQKRCREKHREGVHLNKRAYKCQVCPFETSYSESLRRHVKGVHVKMKQSECKLKEYACEHCELTFVSNVGKRQHINAVHLKIKSNKCSFCSFVTAYSQDFTRHIKTTHEGRQDYPFST